MLKAVVTKRGNSEALCVCIETLELESRVSCPNTSFILHVVHYGVSRDTYESNLWLCCRLQKPIYVSRSSDSYLTTGCWSPSRPAVIYIGLIDGTVEIWDLLEFTHQPSMVVHASACQVTVLEFWKMKTPQFLAVGDVQGIVHIMEIPRSLRRATYKEVLTLEWFSQGLSAIWNLYRNSFWPLGYKIEKGSNVEIEDLMLLMF